MPTLAQVPGNFKQVYWKYLNPLPSQGSIASLTPLVPPTQQEGDSFVFGVQTSYEHGQTSNTDGSGFTLNSPIGQRIQQALIRGASLVMNIDLPTPLMFKAQRANDGPGGGSFLSGMEMALKGGAGGLELYRDLALSYGPGPNAALASNIGTVETTAGGTLNTVQQVRLLRASFIPGLWPVMVNALVDIYQADGTTLRESGVTVIAYPVEGSTRVSMQKVGSGATPTATDQIVPTGWRTTSCFGMEAIFTNLGIMFGIDASITPFWKCQTVAVGGPLSYDKIQEVGVKSSLAGNMNGGKLLVCVNAIASLATETKNNPQFVEGSIGSGGLEEKTQGAQRFKYRTPCGVIEVIPHQQGKQGQGFFLANMTPSEINFKRVGTADITLDIPGDNSGSPLVKDPNRAAQLLRYYSYQAPIFPMPRRNVLLTGIASPSDAINV
jgi:hypothetical protein